MAQRVMDTAYRNLVVSGRLANELPGYVAFAAPSRHHVDDFHATALKHGGRSLSAPVERPEFGFYSAYLADPEGNVLEVCCPL